MPNYPKNSNIKKPLTSYIISADNINENIEHYIKNHLSRIQNIELIITGSESIEKIAQIEKLITHEVQIVHILTSERTNIHTQYSQGAFRAIGEYISFIDESTNTPSNQHPIIQKNTLKSEIIKNLDTNKNPALINNKENQLQANPALPTVSVIVPVFNTASHLNKCLSSIRSQSLKNIEIIIINDGSSDNSLKIIEEHMINDPRIKLISCNKPSGHPGTPRNIGLCAAKGDYVSFIDSDDWIEPNMLEQLFISAIKTKSDITSSTGYFKEEDKNTKIIEFNYNCIDKLIKNNSDSFKSGYFSNIWNRIHRREFLVENGIYFPNIYISEDFCFSSVCHALAESSSKADGYYYHYLYNRPESTTFLRKGPKGLLIIDSFDDEISYFKEFNIFNKFLPHILHKKLNSFWYTYERIDKDLKPFFLKEMRRIFLPFVNSLNFSEFTKDEIGKIKLLGIDLNSNYKNTKEAKATEKERIQIDDSDNQLSALKRANQQMAAKNFKAAKSIYSAISSSSDSALLNLALIGIFEKDLTNTRLNICKLKNSNLAKPIKDFLYKTEKKPISQTTIIPTIPLVSIIVPVHNAGIYLEKCLDSIISQTYRNIEIIAINDGSKDNSKSILKHYAKIDNRLRILNNEIPSGNPGTPRNLGLKKATGHYISFIDSDDWVSSDYIEKLVLSAQCGSDITFASGYINYFKEKETQINYKNTSFNDAAHPLYKYHESFTIWDKLYKADFLKKYAIELGETKAAVDVPFIFKAYYYCNQAAFCNDNYGYYYRRESSASVTLNKRRNSDCSFEFQAYTEVDKWLAKEQIPTWFKDLVGIKKVNSFLYTLTIIGKDYKEEFYRKSKEALLKTDAEKISSYLSLLGRHENLKRYEKIISDQY